MVKRIEDNQALLALWAQRLQERGMSRAEVSEAAGVDRCFLYRNTNPTLSNLIKISEAMDLTIMITDTPNIIIKEYGI